MTNLPLYVTSPQMPDLQEYADLLKQVWQDRHITNCGTLHQQLEQQLCQHLTTPHLSLYSNGTLPIMAALKIATRKSDANFDNQDASNRKPNTGLPSGKPEVVTTPYTFIATAHAIEWCGMTPVFADIDPTTGCMDPAALEVAITPRTVAILPVHVYGRPCDTAAIDAIARRHGLPVIYDAAHAFGVRINGQSILTHGDFSTVSFHATKVFNCVEGGAAVCNSADDKYLLDRMRDFGYVDQTHIAMPGINAKLDELRAAFGLLNLRDVDTAIARRREISQYYDVALHDIPGIGTPEGVIEQLQQRLGISIDYNYPYYPIMVDADALGMTRDDLYTRLQEHGIYTRRYFYPLVSDFAPYSAHASARAENLPNAHLMAERVLALPLSSNMTIAEANRVVQTIKLLVTNA